MMAPVHRVDGHNADAARGVVRLDRSKALWNCAMIIGAIAALFTFNIYAFSVALISAYLLLLFGHSIGMHRLMIHRSVQAKPWLEHVLVGLGSLVGIGGPSSIIAVHDIRDWAQRQADCHDFFSHRRAYLRDLTWQLFYRFEFENPPTLSIEDQWTRPAFYRHLNRYWRWHQIVIASLSLVLGGWTWVLWCVCFRISLCTIGHWTITYICHNPGPARWTVTEAGVQASDFRFPRLRQLSAILTHGECWHSNHHAFPESARIGLEPDQIDPAARLIEIFARWGWVKRIGVPRPRALQEDIQRV